MFLLHLELCFHQLHLLLGVLLGQSFTYLLHFLFECCVMHFCFNTKISSRICNFLKLFKISPTISVDLLNCLFSRHVFCYYYRFWYFSQWDPRICFNNGNILVNQMYRMTDTEVLILCIIHTYIRKICLMPVLHERPYPGVLYQR